MKMFAETPCHPSNAVLMKDGEVYPDRPRVLTITKPDGTVERYAYRDAESPYPADKVAPYLAWLNECGDFEPSERVDTSCARRLGAGKKSVYAYGYGCAPDRLKIGKTDNDAVKRIAEQIKTSTPDKPRLMLEYKTDHPGTLETAALCVEPARTKGRGWRR